MTTPKNVSQEKRQKVLRFHIACERNVCYQSKISEVPGSCDACLNPSNQEAKADFCKVKEILVYRAEEAKATKETPS